MANKHYVYLSFRSEDVGDGFVSHLSAALLRRKIETCVDMENPEAVQDSALSLIIFSEMYVASDKCLDDLVRIMRKPSVVAIPVFYHGKPSRKDLPPSSKASQALKQACNLKGWDSSAMSSESELVDAIVEDVTNKLNRIASNDNSLSLVGIEERVNKIKSLLRIGSPDAMIVGIWGIGGIGKTTLARVVFSRLSFQFESCHFISNVSEESSKRGVIHLRNKLLADIFRDGDHFGPSDRVRGKKVLLVLDDVNNSNQFELLAREHNQFGHGSRVIVTTRDHQVLKNVGAHFVYKVEELNDHEALQLFNDYAFKKVPTSVECKELSEKFVNYAKGIPLTLRVLGSYLRSKRTTEWENELSKMLVVPNRSVTKTLRLSYDFLDHNEKNIFLDVACFFIGFERDLVEQVLGTDHFSITASIDRLIESCLLSLDHSNKLWMHGLVQEMALEVVRQQSLLDPEKSTRLCNAQVHHRLLEDNQGAPKDKVRLLDMSQMENVQWTPTMFEAMTNLRLLRIYHGNNKRLDVNLKGLEPPRVPNSLRYLRWKGYPWKSLPTEFSAHNLVKLSLSSSRLEQLWDGVTHLDNLKHINLSYSEKLIELPDLSRAPNLKDINLEQCTSLFNLPTHIQYLNKLNTLRLNGCSSLDTFPKPPWSIRELYMSETNIDSIPSTIGSLTNLETLVLSSCKRLKTLPTTICRLKSLQRLDMSYCSDLEIFPEILEPMERLRVLSLNSTAICKLPSSLGKLIGLEELDLSGCSSHKSKHLKNITASDCFELRELSDSQLSGLRLLTQLQLSNSRIFEIPDQLFSLPKLESLDLSGNFIAELPTSFSKLSNLKCLNISNCEKLQALPEIPLSMEFVYALGCKSLQSVSSSETALLQGRDQFPVCNEKLLFINCLKLDRNARRNLVTDSHLRFLRMATASRHRFKHGLEYSSVSICYPGKQVPKWFQYQTMGSFLKIKLPRNWRNTNFVGFALCVVAAPSSADGDSPQIHFQCESRFKNKDRKSHEFKRFLRGYSQDYRESQTRMFLCSDHLFMWYDYGLYLDGVNDVFTDASFEFHPADIWDRKVDVGDIKSCGVRLLYLQDPAGFVSKESKVEQLNDFDSESEAGECSIINSHGITEIQAGDDDDEEEEEVIQHDSEQRPGVRNQESPCECLLFLSKIKECYNHILRKKPILNEAMAVEEQLENMDLQIKELQDQNKRVLEHLQKMRPTHS